MANRSEGKEFSYFKTNEVILMIEAIYYLALVSAAVLVTGLFCLAIYIVINR